LDAGDEVRKVAGTLWPGAPGYDELTGYGLIDIGPAAEFKVDSSPPTRATPDVFAILLDPQASAGYIDIIDLISI
jgi:hypothetical protein